MLAGLHEADLGGERGAGAPGEEQPGDDRTELAHQREVDDQPERLGRAVGDQRVVHLQREHEADRQPRGDDDEQREVADRVHLRDDEIGPPQRDRHVAQQIDEEEGVMAKRLQHPQDLAPECRDRADHPTAPRPSALTDAPRNPRPAAGPDSGSAPGRRALRE